MKVFRVFAAVIAALALLGTVSLVVHRLISRSEKLSYPLETDIE